MILSQSKSIPIVKKKKPSKIKDYINKLNNKSAETESVTIAGVTMSLNHSLCMAKSKEPSKTNDISKVVQKPITDYTDRSLQKTLHHLNIKQKEQTSRNFLNMVQDSKPLIISEINPNKSME